MKCLFVQKEEEKLRHTNRPTKPRKRGEGTARQHGNSNTYREEEGSEDEGAISLNAIKNKYKSGGGGGSGGAGGAVPNKGKIISRQKQKWR